MCHVLESCTSVRRAQCTLPVFACPHAAWRLRVPTPAHRLFRSLAVGSSMHQHPTSFPVNAVSPGILGGGHNLHCMHCHAESLQYPHQKILAECLACVAIYEARPRFGNSGLDTMCCPLNDADMAGLLSKDLACLSIQLRHLHVPL